jgi:hypothetical protein
MLTTTWELEDGEHAALGELAGVVLSLPYVR